MRCFGSWVQAWTCGACTCIFSPYSLPSLSLSMKQHTHVFVFRLGLEERWRWGGGVGVRAAPSSHVLPMHGQPCTHHSLLQLAALHLCTPGTPWSASGRKTPIHAGSWNSFPAISLVSCPCEDVRDPHSAGRSSGSPC